MEHDVTFEMTTARIRFGPGVTREVGMELADMGVRRVMVVTDPRLAGLPPVAIVMRALAEARVEAALFDRARVEPTDASFQEAIAFARSREFDAFVAVGGGSVIDTAKAANLYTTHPADFMDYVNAPIGKGLPVPGPLKPLIAVPTTAGTGSETTGVAVFDLAERRLKTGIAHRWLKPTLGLLDPENTRTLPPRVAAYAGLDVLAHAAESYTALPYDRRARPERPSRRPNYQGANPISDVWCLQALRMMAEYLPRAVAHTNDDEARGMMLLAAAYAGIGFGNAGVHLPHAMAYPVAGMVRDYRPDGYDADHPMVPHGLSVILNAPAVFRFTGPACPERHLRAAEALGADIAGVDPRDGGAILADRVLAFMKQLGVPPGLAAVGYTEADIPALVEGTLAQQRLTQLSPRPAGEADLSSLFRDAMRYWG
jgi:hydroxyacid-oxoacid transhydrogenase